MEIGAGRSCGQPYLKEWKLEETVARTTNEMDLQELKRERFRKKFVSAKMEFIKCTAQTSTKTSRANERVLPYI